MTPPTQPPRDTGRAEGLRGALEPFAEAARKALVSGYPPFHFVGASDYERAKKVLELASTSFASPPIDPEASDVEAVAIEINYARYFPTSSLKKRDAAQQWALEDESGKSYALKLAIAAISSIDSLRAQRQKGDTAPVSGFGEPVRVAMASEVKEALAAIAASVAAVPDSDKAQAAQTSQEETK